MAHGVLSKEEAYDQIRSKWMIYHNEHIPHSTILLLNKTLSTQKSIYALAISVSTTTRQEFIKFMMKVVLKSHCGYFQQ